MRLFLARLFGRLYGRRRVLVVTWTGPVAYPCEGILCSAMAEHHADAIAEDGPGPVVLSCYYLCGRCMRELEAYQLAAPARSARRLGPRRRLHGA